MVPSLCAASQTAFSVFSSPGTTLVWRTISRIEAGEAAVDVGDGGDFSGRGVVSRLNVRSCKSSVAAVSSLSLPSPLLRLFGRSPGVGQSNTSHVSKGRFLSSSGSPFSSSAIFPLCQNLCLFIPLLYRLCLPTCNPFMLHRSRSLSLVVPLAQSLHAFRHEFPFLLLLPRRLHFSPLVRLCLHRLSLLSG